MSRNPMTSQDGVLHVDSYGFLQITKYEFPNENTKLSHPNHGTVGCLAAKAF